MKGLRLLLIVVGIAAPALWIAIIWYVRVHTNRWGAFGVAPLFLPLFIANVLVAVAGAVVYLANVRQRRWDIPLGAVAVVNAGILWWAATHR